MLPFYAILRAIPDKFGGVVAMFGSIGMLFVLPWLDTSKVRSMRYRPTMRCFFVIFVVVGLILGWCGAELPDAPVIGDFSDLHRLIDGDLNSFLWLTRFATALLLRLLPGIMPLVGLKEKPLPVPSDHLRTRPVGGHAVPARAAASPEKKG